MEVILLKQCKQGKIGSIVKVKDGFARNYLLPNNIAQRATAENKTEFERKRHELELMNQELLHAAELIKDKLYNASISLVREASHEMKLYGAVSKKDIANALNEKYSLNIDAESIVMPTRIKSIGTIHDIKVKLHHNIVVPIELTIQTHQNH